MTTTTIQIRYEDGDVETFTTCTAITATTPSSEGTFTLTFKGKLTGDADGTTDDEHKIVVGKGMRYTKRTVTT